jgi:hypothetical protein
MSKLNQVESNEKPLTIKAKKGPKKKEVFALQNKWPYAHNYSDSKMNLSYTFSVEKVKILAKKTTLVKTSG